MLKTNENKIVEFLLQCKPGPPKTRGTWRVDHQGEPFILPGIGGITMNIQVGDPAFGWAGDHLEPGVSCIANTDKPLEHPNIGLQIYSCAGNKAKVVSGEAKDAIGTVIGHHGGSEHIIVEFAKEIKEKLRLEYQGKNPEGEEEYNAYCDFLGVENKGASLQQAMKIQKLPVDTKKAEMAKVYKDNQPFVDNKTKAKSSSSGR